MAAATGRHCRREPQTCVRTHHATRVPDRAHSTPHLAAIVVPVHNQTVFVGFVRGPWQSKLREGKETGIRKMPKKKGTKMDNAQDPNNPLDMVMAQPNRQVEILDLAATHQKLEASQAATTTLEPFASPHACVESEAAASGPAAPPSREGEGAAVTSSSVETALSSIRRSAETKKILLLKAKEEAQMKAEERKKNAEEQHQARRKAEEEVEARKKKAGEEKVARPSQKSSIVTL